MNDLPKWEGKYEDWRIDWATYGGPYIRYPDWPHPENGHDIARLSFPDPCPFEFKRKRAALILAAPDMLEALAEIEAVAPAFLHVDEAFADAYDKVRAALKKARGEQQ